MSGQFIVGQQLHPQQSTKAIRLRCVRSYVVTENKGEQIIRSQECLFHDQEGVFIHVHIPKDIVPKYKDMFKEGKVYAIRSFLCITNFFKYKTSTHRYLMKFKHDTLVKEYKRVNFPKTMFRFKSFEALISKQGIDEKVLIDVIGCIVELYSPLEKIIAGKRCRLIDFVLEDSSQKQIKCTLWDEHVDQLTPYFHSAANEPVIVLIQLCRPKIMDNGEVRICSSFGATQLFFSHSCKEFRQLRNSYTSNYTPLRCIDSESRLSETYVGRVVRANDVLITSIEDIYSRKQVGEYWVAGRIVDVESLGDWSYVSCKSNSCKRKVADDGGMMYCSGCKSSWHEGVVRYRVIIRVSDHTGDAPMLLWDRECSELIGVSAGDLKSKYLEGNHCIPPELGCLRGMSMLFRIAMRKEQIESYYSAFTVLRICREEALLTQHCLGLDSCNSEPQIGLGNEVGFPDWDADGDAGSEEFCGSDDEDCVEVAVGSQSLPMDKFVGLDEIKEGLVVGGAAVPMKRSLFEDFEKVGTSKKVKEVVVKIEK